MHVKQGRRDRPHIALWECLSECRFRDLGIDDFYPYKNHQYAHRDSTGLDGDDILPA